MKDLSIIIPCYNYGKYLEHCLGSIFSNETHLTYDITIVDDCSTDNTYNICQDIIKDIPDVKYIRNEKNMRLPETRNIGIRNTNSHYIICLDADDAIPNGYIEENHKIIKNHNVDISYSNTQCFGVSQKLYNWPIDIEYLKKYPFIHCAAMYKRKVWNVLGGYDITLVNGYEDYDFWLRALKEDFKFKKCEKTFLLYRKTYENMSDFINRSKLDEEFKIRHADFYTGLKLDDPDYK